MGHKQKIMQLDVVWYYKDRNCDSRIPGMEIIKTIGRRGVGIAKPTPACESSGDPER